MSVVHHDDGPESALEKLRVKVDSASVPSTLYAEIAHRAQARAHGVRYTHRRLAAAMAAVALVVGGLGYYWLATTKAREGFEIVSLPEGTHLQAVDGALLVQGAQTKLRVSELHVDLTVRAASRLRRERGGIRVASGTVDFEVAHRSNDQPLPIYVSHGSIEVIGTRFAVTQSESGGSVRLDSGAIRFVSDAGDVKLLQPGDVLGWPLAPAHDIDQAPAPEEPAPPAPEQPTQGRAKHPHPAQQRILAEIDALRLRHENGKLVGKLKTWLGQVHEEPLRERLSFELCDVLAQEPREARQACSQIAEHLRRYPGGEHTDQLARTRAHVCPASR